MPALRKILIMIHYPITITDNFFDDPDWVVGLSKKARYTNPDGGLWPGVRSQPLHELDNEFNQYVLQRYFLQFFSHREMTRNWGCQSASYFQRISSKIDFGWIHHDYPQVHTFIIYLTPGADPSSGTGFFKEKNFDRVDYRQQERSGHHSGQTSPEVARAAAEEHNSQYVQTAYCGNVYNRCVGFDSQLAHGVVNYDVNTPEEERLTLITFIDEITGGRTPIANSRSKPFVREGANPFMAPKD